MLKSLFRKALQPISLLECITLSILGGKQDMSSCGASFLHAVSSTFIARSKHEHVPIFSICATT